MIKAIIFDLDGTLTDTLDDLMNAVNYVLGKHNYPLRKRDEIRSFVGNGLKMLMKRSLPVDVGEELLACYTQELIAYYNQYSLEFTMPYPGIVELLKTLKHEGIQCAVATNKREESAVLICERFFPDLLVAVKGDNGCRPLKPDRAIIEELLCLMNVSKEETLYVGDSEADAFTAQNAQLMSIGVLWGFRTKEQLQSVGMQNFAENCEQIHSLVKKYG